MPSPWSRPKCRRASITAISRPCSTSRDIAAPTLSTGRLRAGGAGRGPGCVPLAFFLARSLHAPAHDRAALLHAALRARQATDRRVGGRGGGGEEPALCKGGHGDRHAELGDPYAP